MILLNLLIGVVLRSMEQVQNDLRKTHQAEELDEETKQFDGLAEAVMDLQKRIERLRDKSVAK